MSTIREFLKRCNFDFKNGRIIIHYTTRKVGETESPGWDSETTHAELVTMDNPILDYEFDSGYGAPRCPRFVAEDDEKIYFPVQYDGATWCDFVYRDISEYMDKNVETPYPGS